MKILIALLAVLFASYSAKDSGGGVLDLVKIYYVPIGVETYVPMTPENIEDSATSVGEVDPSSRQFKRLLNILYSSSRGQFKVDDLRVKIILPKNEIIYIDNHGGVRLPSSETHKLTYSDLKTVKKILERTTNKVNMVEKY
ncbi:hypothetical protein [Microbulbifer sp. 2205BS26-8]|uniref:hypothetical protein n=1 Tax=Microbulbifer sp. 2205BS26-8 TaxID=3064386 RepID=UPI00273F62BF|nr:hypothetical protein [Microbulbifer sp. 2205BS26-8]MDP5211332.1 hypothetical protein [Microbulbifer sp. 2205BS26-8]